uniref:Uncharacterized protein n=1 Tax=Ascaris lumbricoides TaxID=6252 RepID=A0A0M3IUF1_ASCLU
MSWEGLRRLKRTSTEGTLTIVEDEDERRKIKDEEENRKTNAMEGKPLQIAAHSAESAKKCNPSLDGNVCIVRITFVILVTILTILSTIQTFQILTYAYFYWRKKKCNVSSSEAISSSVDEYNVVSLDFLASRGRRAKLRQCDDGGYLSTQSSSRTANVSKLSLRLSKCGFAFFPESSNACLVRQFGILIFTPLICCLYHWQLKYKQYLSNSRKLALHRT